MAPEWPGGVPGVSRHVYDYVTHAGIHCKNFSEIGFLDSKIILNTHLHPESLSNKKMCPFVINMYNCSKMFVTLLPAVMGFLNNS